ncbi:MAG: metabolite traffic protein EboE [Verrucomicrobia bacterium]|nr:metabolite traffic protein EboE [Verrucomicrobiota bacterium]
MKLQDQPPLHLTYGLSIHPDETWPELWASIQEKALAVRARVAPGKAFGLGLRLRDAVSREMAEGGNLRRFRQFLDENGLYIFTLNGFPYGRFHGGRVKEQVYAPDWRTEARLDYTRRLADLLAVLLPDGVAGSISTVPGSFKPWIHGASDVERITDQLARAVAHLAGLKEKTGREIHLGLEPEPGCLFETPDELIRFMQEWMWPRGRVRVARELGCSLAAAEQKVRLHLGVCLDTCHVAVCFEDPEEALRQYQAAGLRISKIQLSAALEADAVGRAALARFIEPVYLHQVVADLGGGRLRSWLDLPEALAALGSLPEARAVRVHFHIPLHFEGGGGLRSTTFALRPSFFRALQNGATEHLEIETYSFDALPGGASRDVVESVAGEYRWVLQRLVRAN